MVAWRFISCSFGDGDPFQLAQVSFGFWWKLKFLEGCLQRRRVKPKSLCRLAKVETIPLSKDKIPEPTGSLEILKREKGCYWAMVFAILNEFNSILPWILLKSFAPLRVESYSIRDSLRYTEKRSDEPNFEALLKNKTYTRKLSLHKTRKHLIVPGTLCGKCWWNRKVWLLLHITH